jgi:hypothetical protein
LFSGGSTIIEAPNQPGWTRLKKKREEKSGAEKSGSRKNGMEMGRSSIAIRNHSRNALHSW